MIAKLGQVVKTGKLALASFFLLGCVLVFAGFFIRGLDFGSCPVMGLNEVTSPCFHTFPGTDLPIAPTGDMVAIVGAALIVATLVLLFYPSLRATATQDSHR